MSGEMRAVAHLDRLIHEPSRLVIMSILAACESADFLYLLRETGLTKGNLGAHLGRLEEAGYVEVEKMFVGKVPRTVYRLTAKGRSAFRVYRDTLSRALGSVPE